MVVVGVVVGPRHEVELTPARRVIGLPCVRYFQRGFTLGKGGYSIVLAHTSVPQEVLVTPAIPFTLTNRSRCRRHKLVFIIIPKEGSVS